MRTHDPMRLLALPIASALCLLLADAPAVAGTLHRNNTVMAPDGRLRHFHYFVPSDLPSGAPVVILYHGGNQNFDEVIDGTTPTTAWLEVAEDEKFLLLVPNGIDAASGSPTGANQNWNDCRADAANSETFADDVGFTEVLIDWAIANFASDPSRVYATGPSNGGGMSFRVALELSDRIAAIAAFIANLIDASTSDCGAPVEPIPVFLCNGTSDPLFAYGGGCTGSGNVCWISSEATRDFWIAHNQTDPAPSQTLDFPDLDPRDGSTVDSELYTGGLEGAEVVYYRVAGGGHSLPSVAYQLGFLGELLLGPQNHDVEGAREAWAFLSRHTLDGSLPPPPPPPPAGFSDGFEIGFSKWNDGVATDWNRTSSQAFSGAYSAHAGRRDGFLESDDIDSSGASRIIVRFRYRDDDIDGNDDAMLQLFDGSGHANRLELGTTSPEDTWHEAVVVLDDAGADSVYFRTDFRIRFDARGLDWGENLWIDDVTVELE